MDTSFLHIADLAREVEAPQDGILSRTVLNNDDVKVVLFAFSAGQELSEHTASMPALLYFHQGEAALTLGEDVQHACAGSWTYMPANLKHSVRTIMPTVMLLVLIKRQPK